MAREAKRLVASAGLMGSKGRRAVARCCINRCWSKLCVVAIPFVRMDGYWLLGGCRPIAPALN